jgi:CRISPR/Cas system-associated protein endoribonuclease Cas2
MPVKAKRAPEKESSEEAPSQRKQTEAGRYLLQVDRQTKSSFNTFEAARSAAMQIKTGFPMLQVSIYDSVSKSYTLVDLPARSSSQP